MEAPRWIKGERVQITVDGRTVVGNVVLASGNGRSLMLQFDAMLRGYAGMMPVLWEGDEYRDLINHFPVVVKASHQ